MTTQTQKSVISVMLAVSDTPAAVEWYKRALGAKQLWSLGSVDCSQLINGPTPNGQRLAAAVGN